MKLLTCEEAAKRLRVSIDSVWRYTRQGKLKVVKLTKRTYRIPENELKRFIKRQTK